MLECCPEAIGVAHYHFSLALLFVLEELSCVFDPVISHIMQITKINLFPRIPWLVVIQGPLSMELIIDPVSIIEHQGTLYKQYTVALSLPILDSALVKDLK